MYVHIHHQEVREEGLQKPHLPAALARALARDRGMKCFAFLMWYCCKKDTNLDVSFLVDAQTELEKDQAETSEWKAEHRRVSSQLSLPRMTLSATPLAPSTDCVIRRAQCKCKMRPHLSKIVRNFKMAMAEH